MFASHIIFEAARSVLVCACALVKLSVKSCCPSTTGFVGRYSGKRVHFISRSVPSTLVNTTVETVPDKSSFNSYLSNIFHFLFIVINIFRHIFTKAIEHLFDNLFRGCGNFRYHTQEAIIYHIVNIVNR